MVVGRRKGELEWSANFEVFRGLRTSFVSTTRHLSFSQTISSMTKQFEASTSRIEGNTHVLIITTGSVASIKLPLIVEELAKVSPPPLLPSLF